jgi:hypothetical protein
LQKNFLKKHGQQRKLPFLGLNWHIPSFGKLRQNIPAKISAEYSRIPSFSNSICSVGVSLNNEKTSKWSRDKDELF